MDEVVSMLGPQAEIKGIKLLATVDDKDLTITSDSDKFRHILQNLLGNAVKFTEEGGVAASIRKVGNELYVSVSDTGIGIPKEYLRK